jgi:hypothetical protein
VIRRADSHGVKVVLFPIDQLAKVVVFPGVWISPGSFPEVLRIDVANGDDVVSLELSNDRPTPIADADDGEVDSLARCKIARTSQDVSRYDSECGECGTGSQCLQKLSAPPRVRG